MGTHDETSKIDSSDTLSTATTTTAAASLSSPRKAKEAIVDSSKSKGTIGSATKETKSLLGKRRTAIIDDYALALRPMITYYAIMDHLAELHGKVTISEQEEDNND